MLLGLGTTLGLSWVRGQALPERRLREVDAGLLALLGGLIGGRMAFVAADWAYFQSNRGEIPLIHLGGTSWAGALVGGLVALAHLGWVGLNNRFIPGILGFVPVQDQKQTRDMGEGIGVRLPSFPYPLSLNSFDKRQITMKLTISLAQINTKLGDVEANLEKHLALAQEARTAGADLLVFPELSLTGYVLQDLASTVAHPPSADDPVFRHLLEVSHDLDLVVGFVDEDRRHRFFIASAYLSQGKVVHVHHKVYLPTYGLFDEGRFFAWGDAIRAFDTRFGRAGILICEDFWHASPPYLLWLDGADLFLFASASPGRGLSQAPQLESARWVEHINKAYASMFTSF